jgi:hypothetical protein
MVQKKKFKSLVDSQMKYFADRHARQIDLFTAAVLKDTGLKPSEVEMVVKTNCNSASVFYITYSFRKIEK